MGPLGIPLCPVSPLTSLGFLSGTPIDQVVEEASATFPASCPGG